MRTSTADKPCGPLRLRHAGRQVRAGHAGSSARLRGEQRPGGGLSRCGSWTRLGVRTLYHHERGRCASTRTTEVGDFCIIEPIRSISRGAIPSPRLDPANIVGPLLLHAGRVRPRAAPPSPTTMAAELRRAGARRACTWARSDPSFETPAEIRMFRSWGADTVAMSVCEEVIAARHVGMRVLGISLVCEHGLRHRGRKRPRGVEVLDVAQDARGRLLAPDHGHRRAAVVGEGEPPRRSGCEGGAPARAAAQAPALRAASYASSSRSPSAMRPALAHERAHGPG